MEHLPQQYKIMYGCGKTAYIWVDLSGTEYGSSANELSCCEDAELYAYEDVIYVHTAHGHLSHRFTDDPEWYTTHKVEILDHRNAAANESAVQLEGSILCRILLDEGEAFFCIVEGYRRALYGKSLQGLTSCELRDVEVFRDGGTINIETNHGLLYIPSPLYGVREQPEWTVYHEVEQLRDLQGCGAIGW